MTEIVGDAHFPGESCNDNIIRADGLGINDRLDAILPLFVLDRVMEQRNDDGTLAGGQSQSGNRVRLPEVHDGYAEIVQAPADTAVSSVDKYDFDRTKKAFAVVMTASRLCKPDSRRSPLGSLKKNASRVYPLDFP